MLKSIDFVNLKILFLTQPNSYFLLQKQIRPQPEYYDTLHSENAGYQ